MGRLGSAIGSDMDTISSSGLKSNQIQNETTNYYRYAATTQKIKIMWVISNITHLLTRDGKIARERKKDSKHYTSYPSDTSIKDIRSFGFICSGESLCCGNLTYVTMAEVTLNTLRGLGLSCDTYPELTVSIVVHDPACPILGEDNCHCRRTVTLSSGFFFIHHRDVPFSYWPVPFLFSSSSFITEMCLFLT
ncbi:hypothetical protein STEG23_036568, partial [Scotinomys teguina]